MPPKRLKRSKRPSLKRAPAPVELDKPLPKCEGPKLGIFEHHKAAIQFVSLLSGDSPGEDGHVFEVVIDSKHYALKVVRGVSTIRSSYSEAKPQLSPLQFKFYDPPSDPDGLKQFGLSEETYIGQTDPFYAECRAYGCIVRNQRNGKVAVSCYGFIGVPAEREDDLAAPPFEVDEWNRPEEEYESPTARRQPFRAIVKKLIRRRKRLGRVREMREDLLALQKMGVYVQDIREDNYINGKLIDFSRSWTEPHALLDPHIRSQRLINAEIEGDLLDFDRMMEEAGILTRLKASSESSQVGRLRAHIRKPDRYGL